MVVIYDLIHTCHRYIGWHNCLDASS